MQVWGKTQEFHFLTHWPYLFLLSLLLSLFGCLKKRKKEKVIRFLMNYCIQRDQKKDQCFFIFKINNNLSVDGGI